MRLGEPELHAAPAKCRVQLGEELGAGQVDSRHRAEEQDDQPHRILARAQELEHALANELRVEVEQR